MSYLADIKMPDREIVQEEIEIRDEETGEVDPNFIYEEEVADDGVEEEQDPLPPPPEKKVKLKKEDIFKPKNAPPKKVAPPLEPEPAPEPIVPKIAPVQKKKRVMSEAQKEALKKGREKRMANKKQKTQSKTEPVQESVKPPSPVAEQPKQATQIYYDKDELADLVFQGVQRYDNMRKERKEKKKKSQAQANHDQKVFKDINNAISRQSDPWGDCFR